MESVLDELVDDQCSTNIEKDFVKQIDSNSNREESSDISVEVMDEECSIDEKDWLIHLTRCL